MITGTAPKAAAADITDKAGWINLLDYTTIHDGSNFFSFNSSTEVEVSMPFQTDLYYVDMLVTVTQNTSNFSVTAIWPAANQSANLKVVSLGNELYRVYGALYRGFYSSLKLRFSSAGITYCTVQSLRVCTVSRTVTPETGYIYYQDRIVSEMTSPGQAIGYQGYSNAVGVDFVRYNVRYWYKYDAVEVAFQVLCHEVVGINAYVGDYNLPVEISYFQNDDVTVGNYYAIATIDLSGVPRDLAYDLTLQVRGTVRTNQFDMYLYEVMGITYIEPPSPLRYWFTNLFGKLSSWFTNVINTVYTGFSNVGTWLSSGFQSVVNKLDELINGSSDGSSDQIKDDLGSVGDFEDRYHNTVEGNWGDVSGSLDQVVGGSNFIGAASFYSDIVQTIFESVPDYGVVLTAVLCVSVVFSLL